MAGSKFAGLAFCCNFILYFTIKLGYVLFLALCVCVRLFYFIKLNEAWP